MKRPSSFLRKSFFIAASAAFVPSLGFTGEFVAPVEAPEAGFAAVPGGAAGAAPSLEDARADATRVFDAGVRESALNVADTLRSARASMDAARRAQGEESRPSEWTPLQKHAAFFDRDGDGIVTLQETVESLKLLGIGGIKADAIALAIHLGLGPKTSGRWDSLDIVIKNIQVGKHASDTGVYDGKGFFVPAAFESLFARFDTNNSGSLSESEIAKMIAADSAQRPGGAAVATAEFSLLLDIAADRTEVEKGKSVRAISKEQLRRFYDGSLLYAIAKKNGARN